jgi:hypothetical protein
MLLIRNILAYRARGDNRKLIVSNQVGVERLQRQVVICRYWVKGRTIIVVKSNEEVILAMMRESYKRPRREMTVFFCCPALLSRVQHGGGLGRGI